MANTCYRQRTTYKDKIRVRDKNTCQLCGAPGEAVDHIIPYAVSQDSSPSNLRLLCRSCNNRFRRERRDSAIPYAQWYDYLQTELTKCAT